MNEVMEGWELVMHGEEETPAVGNFQVIQESVSLISVNVYCK